MKSKTSTESELSTFGSNVNQIPFFLSLSAPRPPLIPFGYFTFVTSSVLILEFPLGLLPAASRTPYLSGAASSCCRRAASARASSPAL